MSRAFIKEPEGQDFFEDLPDRPISEHPNFVTANGLALIEAALERAHREHATAQAANDRAGMARAARELRYWNARRASAQVIPATADTLVVQFGSRVTIERGDGRRQTYSIVGEDEAEPRHGTISHASPLARSLRGRCVGDVVRVAGHDTEILAIE